MLAHVNGLVAEKGENMLVIDCGGVGYQLTVSAATLAQAPAAYPRQSPRQDTARARCS